MKPARAKEVLYDSETVLRLVERELQELRNDMTVPPSSPSRPDAKAKASAKAANVRHTPTPAKRRHS